MKPLALAGALGGGVFGLTAWAVVAAATGVVFAHLAWVVGGVVGCVAAACGGHGRAAGITCAAVALAAVFVGRGLACECALPSAAEWSVCGFLWSSAEAAVETAAPFDAAAARASAAWAGATGPEHSVDFLFAILGVLTAYGVCTREREDAAAYSSAPA